MSTAGLRARQAEATRARLCRVARRLFAAQGYTATGTDDIVRRARVTKGALYHHFTDKQDLFRAVVEDLEQELADAVAAAAAAETDPWEALERPCEAYLDRSLQRDVQRILVLDAPSVLGWQQWCEIDKRFGYAMFEGPIRGAMAAGVIETKSPETLAQLLLGSLNVAARVVAGSDDPAGARDQVWATVLRLLSGLRVAQS